MKAFAHISTVAFAYAAVWIAELTYNTSVYYLVCALFFAISCTYASCITMITKSKLTAIYASSLFLAAIFNSYMQFDSGYYMLENLYYFSPLNYCLLMLILELAIMIRGATDVIYRLLFLHDSDSSGDDNSGAGMVSHL